MIGGVSGLDVEQCMRVLRDVAGRLALDVDAQLRGTADEKVLRAVAEWAGGGPYAQRGVPTVLEDGDVLPDYQAAATDEWVWVSPGDRYSEPGSWALGRTAGGVGIHIRRGDGDRPAEVHDPAHLAAAIVSALRREGPA